MISPARAQGQKRDHGSAMLRVSRAQTIAFMLQLLFLDDRSTAHTQW